MIAGPLRPLFRVVKPRHTRKSRFKLLLPFLLCATANLKSEDWTSITGTTYKNVVVIKVDSDSVTIKDDDGTAVVSLSKLPPEIRNKLIASASSTPSSIPISGQVFIVTRGGQNLKLGGIHVRIYLLEDIGGIIKRRQEAAVPIIAKLQPVLKALSDAWLKVSQQEMADGGKSQWSTDVEMERNLNAKMDEIRKRLDDLSNGEYFLADLPPPVSDVQTDADGKFTAEVDTTGSYVVTATAVRDVGEHNENYHWIFKIGVSNKIGKNVLLTNENMIYQNSPDSLVNAK